MLPDSRFTVEDTLVHEESRSLHVARDPFRKGKLCFLEELRFPSSVEAAAACEAAKAWQNLLSLNYHPSFLNPLEILSGGESMRVLYEGVEGHALSHYLKEFFKGYPADEAFALELTWHLVEIVCAVVSQGGRTLVVGAVACDDIFLSGEGRLKLLAPSMERNESEEAQRNAVRRHLRAFGELLFSMLTLEAPRERGASLARCREVNGEITEPVEALVRRCVLDEESGGFPTLLSLRQALHELLKSRGEAGGMREGYMRAFKGEKPQIEYREKIEEAVVQEGEFQARLRSFDFRREFPLLADLLKDAWRQLDWRKMWPFYAVPYMIFMTPLLLAVQIRTAADLLWPFVLIALTLPAYVGLIMAFSHVRRPID